MGRVYQRLNEDYRPLHALCRLLLAGMGPDIEQGRNAVLPFSLNMASLFEEFVAIWLAENIGQSFVLKSQHYVKLKSDTDFSFKIDLVIRERQTGRPIAVMDTKYKDAEAPSQTDVNQVVAYAVELGVKRAYLVYPSALAKPFFLTTGGIEVRSLCFDIGDDISSAGARFPETFLSDIECGWSAQ